MTAEQRQLILNIFIRGKTFWILWPYRRSLSLLEKTEECNNFLNVFYTQPLDETQGIQINVICPLFLQTLLLIILPNSLVFQGSRALCLLSMQIWCSGCFVPFARQSQELTGGGECFGCCSDQMSLQSSIRTSWLSPKCSYITQITKALQQVQLYLLNRWAQQVRLTDVAEQAQEELWSCTEPCFIYMMSSVYLKSLHRGPPECVQRQALHIVSVTASTKHRLSAQLIGIKLTCL